MFLVENKVDKDDKDTRTRKITNELTLAKNDKKGKKYSGIEKNYPTSITNENSEKRDNELSKQNSLKQQKIYKMTARQDKFDTNKSETIITTKTNEDRKSILTKKYRPAQFLKVKNSNADALNERKKQFIYKQKYGAQLKDQRTIRERNLFKLKQENNALDDMFTGKAVAYTTFALRSGSTIKKQYDKSDDTFDTMKNVAETPLIITKNEVKRKALNTIKNDLLSKNRGKNLLQNYKNNRMQDQLLNRKNNSIYKIRAKNKLTDNVSLLKRNEAKKGFFKQQIIKDNAKKEAAKTVAKQQAAKAAASSAAKGAAASSNAGLIALGAPVILVLLLFVILLMAAAAAYPFGYNYNKDDGKYTVADDKEQIKHYCDVLNTEINRQNWLIDQKIHMFDDIGDVNVVDYGKYIDVQKYNGDLFLWTCINTDPITGILNENAPDKPEDPGSYIIDPTDIEASGNEIGPIFEGYCFSSETDGEKIPNDKFYYEILALEVVEGIRGYNKQPIVVSETEAPEDTENATSTTEVTTDDTGDETETTTQASNKSSPPVIMDDETVLAFYSTLQDIFWTYSEESETTHCTPGCRTKTVTKTRTTTIKNEDGTTTTSSSTYTEEEKYCPGHIKIHITLKFNFNDINTAMEYLEGKEVEDASGNKVTYDNSYGEYTKADKKLYKDILKQMKKAKK